MRLFVDTSVWSLAFRRDTTPGTPEVEGLRRALLGEDAVFTTGLVLQELLQGLAGPRAKQEFLGAFSALPLLVPQRDDHVEAAALRDACRRRGVRVGTIDALLARLCVRHDLVLLTTDDDFARMRPICALTLWRP